MSRWPIDAPIAGVAAARVRALRARATRAWARARGRLPRHDVYLHAQGVLSWPGNGTDAAAASAFASFAAWCAAHAGAQARVHVTGQASQGLVIDPALGISDADAVRRYAVQQFTHYHGPQAAAWPLAVWDGGACGLHGLDLAALRADAAAHDVRLAGVAPVWCAGLPALASRHPAFDAPGPHALLLVEGACATWLVAENRRATLLRQRYLDAAHADAVIQLLDGLVRESPPLASLPVVAGWGIDAPASIDPDVAVVLGDLGGPGGIATWIRARPKGRS